MLRKVRDTRLPWAAVFCLLQGLRSALRCVTICGVDVLGMSPSIRLLKVFRRLKVMVRSLRGT